MSAPNVQTSVVGGQSGTPFAAFGATPTTQPSGPMQGVLARGQQAGVLATYSSTQSPAAVAQSTTAEQTFTVQSGTGGTMLLASGDILFVNKPAAQAGLGMGNVRVSGSNQIGLTFDNIPAGGNITPTGAQVYKIAALRGASHDVLTPSLSPVAVPANSASEQTFSVPGLGAGFLVQVMKPAAQAGLDLGGCRVVTDNVLGITFINATAAAITPTAAETYSVWATPGFDAINNDVFYGFNVGTVGAIGAGIVVTGGATTLTGMLATDIITGIQKPTAQAVATNYAIPAYGIPTADTLTLYFAGVGTGMTPTASEVYGIRTARLNPAAPLVVFTQSLAPVSVAALTTAEQTFSITSPNTLIAGSVVWVNKSSSTAGLAIVGMRVSAANTLALTYANMTGTAIVPPTETYTIGNFQVPAPGAGNVVYQGVAMALDETMDLSNALRQALVTEGWIAGA